MTLDIELEHNHLNRPEKTQTGDLEKDYYLDIIFRLEQRAYELLKTRKRTKTGKLAKSKGNEWKRSSAKFFKSLASQGKAWIDGDSDYQCPWSFKQWNRIRSILRDNSLRPYQEKIESEKYRSELEELKRKAAAYDAMILNNGNGHSDDIPTCNECSRVLTQAEIDLGDCLCDECNSTIGTVIDDYDLEMNFI